MLLIAAAVASAGTAAASADEPDRAAGATTTRVSVSSSGVQGDRLSFGSDISARGRYVAFASDATNLVPRDTNGASDVFIRDRLAGTTRRVSIGPSGREGNGSSYGPVMSADGRYVAFHSAADNLVAGDTNTRIDVFLRDLQTSTTRLVSLDMRGQQPVGESFVDAISDDGRLVVFTASGGLDPADTNAEYDAYARDLQAGVTRWVSVGYGGQPADDASFGYDVSADGRYVVFVSFGSNIVAGDTNGERDVFVRDLQRRTTRRISVGPGGRQADGGSPTGAISADGRFVAFTSWASNLVSGDGNETNDVFVRDRVAGTTRLVSVGLDGQVGNRESVARDISADGRYVLFDSVASNLVDGDTNGLFDTFVRDRLAGTTERVSVGPGGRQANNLSFSDAISPDGRHVTFSSGASNLVAGDTNRTSDVFAWDEAGDVRAAR